MIESLERSFSTLVDHSVFLLLVLPLVGAALVGLSVFGWVWFGFSAQQHVEVIRRTALTNVLLSAVLSAVMVANYDVPRAEGDSPPRLLQMASESNTGPSADRASARGEQARSSSDSEDESDHSSWAVRIAVGVDGVSLWFVAAISLLMIPAVIAHWDDQTRNPAVFFMLILLLQSALVGLFAALDVVMFCVCVEAATLLMFLLLGAWGGEDRRRVSVPYFHYQRLGSVLVFVGIVALVMAHSWTADATESGGRELSFSIAKLTSGVVDRNVGNDVAAEHWRMMRPLIVLPLMLGFAIKASLFPLHRWLPAAQTESPTVIGIVLCGVSVNVGIYGCIRLLLPVFLASNYANLGALMTWALFSAVLAGLLALAQGDFRRLIAYAVVAHAGVSVAGVFSFNPAGVAGSALRAVSLGLSLGGLAYLIGAIRRRFDTFEIKTFGGLLGRYPRLAILFALLVLAAVGVPGTGGFAASLSTLLGIFSGPAGSDPYLWSAVAALCALLLIASAMIWMMQRIVFGPFPDPVIGPESFAAAETADAHASGRQPGIQHDLTTGECATLVPLLAVVLWIGLAPQFFLERIEPSVRWMLPQDESEGESLSITKEKP